MEWLQTAREFFKNDIFATECAGVEIIEAQPGHAVCRLDIQPRHCNAAGLPMGGAVFTLADFAFAIAANLGRELTVTQNASISYLSSARGKELIARARLEKAGRRTCFGVVEVSDDTGAQVAYYTAGGFCK